MLQQGNIHERHLGRFLTPDPKGYTEGPNLYAYLLNNPLTQFDLYGLAVNRDGIVTPLGGKPFDPPSGKVINIAAGVAHGAIDFSIDLAKFPCVITNLIYSSPGIVYSLCTGEDPFQDFSLRNQNINICFDQATEMACFLIPADTSSPYYQYSRAGTKLIGDAALLATGAGAAYKGYQAARAGVTLGSEVYSIAKSGKTFLRSTTNKVKFSKLPRQKISISRPSNPRSIWSSTKQRSAVENAFFHRKSHGKEFPNLQNAKQYVETARRTINNPNPSTLFKIRQNGQIMIFNTETNTFSVFTKNKVPKTMFKPSKGLDYWEIQR